jgi:hypothetical protein
MRGDRAELDLRLALAFAARRELPVAGGPFCRSRI